MAAMTSLIHSFIFLLLLRIGSAKSQRHYHAYQAESDSHGNSHSHPGSYSHESNFHRPFHAHRQSSKSKLLPKLSESPLVLIMSPEALAGSYELSFSENIDLLRAILSQKTKDDDVYRLYSALRSTQPEVLGRRTHETLQKTLKEKLQKRCKIESTCQNTCEKVKNANNCSVLCAKKFDENTLCALIEAEFEGCKICDDVHPHCDPGTTCASRRSQDHATQLS